MKNRTTEKERQKLNQECKEKLKDIISHTKIPLKKKMKLKKRSLNKKAFISMLRQLIILFCFASRNNKKRDGIGKLDALNIISVIKVLTINKEN